MARFSRQSKILIGVILAVVLCDLVSKELALVLLSGAPGGGTFEPTGFSLLLAINDGAAGGADLGDYTRLINVMSMLVVATLSLLVWRQLATMHRIAPVALGLITGAALGNTMSLFIRPGVVDFIAYNMGNGAAIIFNVADIAVFAGIGSLIPVAFAVASRIRSGYGEVRTPAPRSVVPSAQRPLFDREVPIVFASEVAIEPEVQERIERDRSKRTDIIVVDRPADLDSPEELRG